MTTHDDRVERVMSDRLVDTMKRYGLKAEVLGTDEDPSPEGQAIGDLLAHLLATEDENARLRAQVKYLRDRMIHETICRQQERHGPMTREQIRFIIGAIDSNMVVAADRVVKEDD